ncbi:MAG: hypothetical protein IID45_06155 [Planctomycetes bacterium]|nr:hypothetical protein [Planctomycetota bacterium]
MIRFALRMGIVLGFTVTCEAAAHAPSVRPKGPAPELALLRYSGGKFIISRTRDSAAKTDAGLAKVRIQSSRPKIERFVDERPIREFDVYSLSGVRYKGEYLSQLVKWLGARKTPTRILLSTNGQIVDPYYRGFAKSGTLILVPRKRPTTEPRDVSTTGARKRKPVQAKRPRTARPRPNSRSKRAVPRNSSLPGTRNVRVTFRNTGRQSVHVFWIDYEGREKDFGVLAPQERMEEQSGHAHLWRFKAYGETIAAYRVRRQPIQDYAIRPPKHSLTKVEAEVWELVNAARSSYGLTPLRHDWRLSAAARDHSQQMSRTGNFSHTSWVADKFSFIERARIFGTSANSENIAWDGGGAQSVVNMWLNSPGHRANMLDPNSTTIGIGHSDVYWTQMFGSAPRRTVVVD